MIYKCIVQKIDLIQQSKTSWEMAQHLLELYCSRVPSKDCPHKCEVCISKIMEYLNKEA